MSRNTTAELAARKHMESIGAFKSNLDREAVATGQYNSTSVLSAGVYDGYVTAVDMSARTIDVKLNGVEVRHCTYVPLMLASFVGVSCNYLPPLGAPVVVLFTAGRGYAIGARSSVSASAKSYKGRATGDPGKDNYVIGKKAYKSRKRAKGGKSNSSFAHFPAGDMVPGEIEFSDNMGTALRVLYGLAQLTAGEQAKVEVSLLNDMVRITDNYFAHHMAGGDTLSWTWGKYATMEEHFTGHQFEADGKKDKDSALTKKKKNGSFEDKEAPDVKSRYSDTGRWRKSTYTGFLGDMIHTFVTQPTEVISSTMEGAVRPGLYRSWVGSDGTLLIQAAGGVHVEVTSKDIIVPEVDFAWNDPELVEKLEGQLDSLDSKYDKLWGSGPDWKDLGAACWQMSAYLRYMTYFHSLSRWHQLAKTGYCKVPKPGDSKRKPAEATNGDKDREKSCPDGKYPYIGQASFSIDPSGSITAQSNGVVSMVMNNGNLHLAAAGNIEIQAGNTVSISGRHVSLRSLFEMEIVSMLGKITQKAKTAFKLFCEKGRLWLKSDASDETKDYEPDTFDDEDNKVEFAKHAIVIDAGKGSIISQAEKSNIISSNSEDNYGSEDGEGEPEYDDSKPVGVVLRGKRVNVIGGTMFTKVTNLVSKAVMVTTSAQKVFANIANLVYSKLFKLTGTLLKGKLTLNVNGSVAAKGGFTGPNEKVSVQKDKKAWEDMTELDEGDVSQYDEVFKIFDEEMENAKFIDYIEQEFKDDKELEWRFRKWKVGTSPEHWASVKRPIVYSTIAAGKTVEQGSFKECNWAGISAPEGKHVNKEERPWPGITGIDFYYDKYADPLGAPMKKEFDVGDIGGWDKMSRSEYTTYVMDKESETLEIFKKQQ